MMNFSLPILTKFKKADGDKARPRQRRASGTADDGRHASLGTVKFHILVVGVLLLVVLTLFIFHFMSIAVSRALAQDNARTTQQVAMQLRRC
jgi:hypothetical protein